MLCNSIFALAQSGVIKGRVFNYINNEAVPFAAVVLDSSTVGVTTDIDGNYRLENVTPGIHTISVSFIGFKTVTIDEITVSTATPVTVDIAMTEESTSLEAVEITAEVFTKSEEAPLSMRTINATEIYRNPGGNRDISKVISILPGVAGSTAFRNDLIVRGGAPNENRFFLDGIEVPNINHFATQGSSGGPVGMINVNFIQDVDFYAGAFPTNRGNALSSVMNFTQKSGNDERLSGNFLLGSSDVGLTLDGPIGKKTTFLASARRSYLQFLFQALKLPFLPTYNDFQFKTVTKFNQKNQLTFIGLGAIDDFALNKSVNDGETDQETIDRNNYTLANIPVNTQWNYTLGASYKHFAEKSYQTFVVSRNHLSNKAIKYQNNVEVPENLLLDYVSEEIENKVRAEHDWRNNGWKLNVGAGFENVTYTNQTYNKVVSGGIIQVLDFSSNLTFNKYAAFGSLSKKLLKDRLTLSAGIRTDFNDYSNDMSNPLDQLSPRLAASYVLSPKLNVNANIGRYNQLPPYTVMGYRNPQGTLVNQQNNLTYITADHIVAGLEYLPKKATKVTLEGFYKTYSNYPFLTTDSISLANLGGDFGVIGSEPAVSTGLGRSYGAELFIQQKLTSSVYGILSYTFVRSEFTDKNNQYVPSSWDNRHVLNITAGKKFKNNWEVGAKFRFLGGAPYTPYDAELSSKKEIWDVANRGIPNYDLLNTQRVGNSHGLDVRVDKKWYYNKWSLNAYIDIQNIYNFQAEGAPYLDVVRDENGLPVTDPNDPTRYQTKEIQNLTGTLLPSIGLMVDF